VSHHGGSPVQLGHGPEIDCKGEHDLLSLAQSEIGRLNEHARGAQIDGLTQFPAAARNGDVDNGSSSMPRMQAAFHLNQPRVFLVVVRRDGDHYAAVRPDAMEHFNLISK
jgi:hypothetical protein